MIELLVIRHGQSVADIIDVHEGRADFPLTDLGKEQARRAAEWIAVNYPLQRIYASTLKRAAETAEIIGQRVNLTVEFDPDLMEFNNGVLAGLPFAEAAVKYPLPPGGRKPHEPVPGGETAIEFRMRAETVWSKILNTAEENQRIAIVSHGGMIAMLYRAFLRLPVDVQFSSSTGDTGIHLWRVNGAQRSLVFANYQEHLR